MADAFDDEVDAEPTISIGDYLKAVEEEELEADLVLGGDEGKECTYNKGYLKRQAIFSCLTCTPDGNAGVCTACSLSCHEGHEVLELWTKRNFKCDCGNSKFGEFFCKLMASKDVENSSNKYNHNFKGTYCTCDLPYPDPDVEEQVEMIQCCVCEDWFHEEHIGLQPDLKIPRDEEGEPLYEDFICQGCAKLCSFLSYYSQIISAPNTSDISTSGALKEKAVLENNNSVSAGNHENSSCSLEPSSSSNVNSNTAPPEANNIEGAAKECTEVAGQSSECIFERLVGKGVPQSAENNKPLFLSKNWRETLCTCGKCSEMYAQNGISFLLDKEDSIAEYEKVAKQRRSENMQKQEGAEMSFLNNLGHVEKMEILSGIADMKNEIFSFLESSDPSKPITTADVQQVFENLAKKRKHDIIKMSKTRDKKHKKQRVPNKGQNNVSQDKSSKVRRFMDTRSSMRQGALAKRRTNFQGNQFPLAAEAAKKAAAAPIRSRAFSRNRQFNVNTRVEVMSVRKNSANRSGFKKPVQQTNAGPKQKPQTLDSLFANMKEERMRSASQQSNGSGRNGGTRHVVPWARGHQYK
ncbi:PHD finger family protein [Striga asiatica]|uniref:PHD finger family protein n=1 Tax=Striga asiatica TaxID=4170 RepID=A0A5A7PC61_STRAF|nr:PHD finger family protein [Striga asiatica]